MSVRYYLTPLFHNESNKKHLIRSVVYQAGQPH